MSTLLPLLLVCSLQSSPAEQAGLRAPIAAVTVHLQGARVERRVGLPAGTRLVHLVGLPLNLDQGSVQLRLEGAELVHFEFERGAAEAAPLAQERWAQLRAQFAQLLAELQGLQDQQRLEQLRGSWLRSALDDLTRAQLAPGRRLVRGEAALAGVWSSNAGTLSALLAEAQNAEQRLAQSCEERNKALSELSLALQGATQNNGESLGLVAQIEPLGTAPIALSLEYLIGPAHWEPYYDLRATRALDSVELVYRARVQQATGEDWQGVSLALSTARPERGVSAQEARPVWLSFERDRELAQLRKLQGLAYLGEETKDKDTSSGRAMTPAQEPDAAPPRTVVEALGLSLRYQLPGPLSIPSRPAATAVLVGRAQLAVQAEHRIVPAVDARAWLLARTTNTSSFVLLPGTSSVFFGADYLGDRSLGLVPPGAELELDLGPDSGLVVERSLLSDTSEEAGIFGSKDGREQHWRVHLENRGALSSAGPKGARVVLLESLPEARDERIEVRLQKPKLALSASPRFARDREQLGLLPWELTLAPGAQYDLEWGVEVRWPEDLELRWNALLGGAR